MENINNAVNTGFNLEAVDQFKKYKGLEGCYIIENYIRHKHFNSVHAIYENFLDAMTAMDVEELWEDCLFGYVTDSGYPSFHLDY